jgi:hypothetical protein
MTNFPLVALNYCSRKPADCSSSIDRRHKRAPPQKYHPSMSHTSCTAPSQCRSRLCWKDCCCIEIRPFSYVPLCPFCVRPSALRSTISPFICHSAIERRRTSINPRRPHACRCALGHHSVNFSSFSDIAFPRHRRRATPSAFALLFSLFPLYSTST